MSELALFGGTPACPTRSRQVPKISNRDKEALLRVLLSRNWGGIPFPATEASAFAVKFNRLIQVKHGFLVANGSVALSLALRAAGVRAGDEVITTGYTWVASASSIVHINAVPVLVDIDPETYCIDPLQVQAAITPRTKALLPVHLAGNVADMESLLATARRHNLVVIEDCAHAHFAKWEDHPVGGIGDLGCFSFEQSKILTSGEGGFVSTNDDELASRVASLANCGRKEPGLDRYDGRVLGWNCRATEFQAALLDAQLACFDENARQREKNRSRLVEGLMRTGAFSPLAQYPKTTTTQSYVLVLKYHADRANGVPRDRFLEALLAEGVEFEGKTFYEPVHRDPLFTVSALEWPMIRERYGEAIRPEHFHLPVCDRAAYHEAVWIHHWLYSASDIEVDLILEAVRKVIANLGQLHGP